MWKCKHCGLLVMFSAVEPEVNADGCYFLCPGCEHRNKLENVNKSGDGVALAQPSD